MVFMVKVNDFLTDKQIELLINDIGSNNLVVLFFMSDTEKINYFHTRKSVWRSLYLDYNKKFDDLLYEESFDIANYRSYSEKENNLIRNIYCCTDYIKIYDILLDYLYDSASFAP